MSAIDIALPRLQTEEGFRARLYKDTNGYGTIGYGFNVDAGITPRAAAALLRAQVEELNETLLGYSWYAALDPVRQSVCLDIAVNEGLHGLLAFPRMISALSHQDWSTASRECHVADPKIQGRYNQLSHLLLVGGTQ